MLQFEIQLISFDSNNEYIGFFGVQVVNHLMV